MTIASVSSSLRDVVREALVVAVLRAQVGALVVDGLGTASEESHSESNDREWDKS